VVALTGPTAGTEAVVVILKGYFRMGGRERGYLLYYAAAAREGAFPAALICQEYSRTHMAPTSQMNQPPPAEEGPPAPEGWDIAGFVRLIRTRWRTIFYVALTFFLLVFFFSIGQPWRYESHARLVVQSVSPEQAALISGQVPMLQRFFGLDKVANQLQFLHSRTLATRVVDEMNLQVRVGDPRYPSGFFTLIFHRLAKIPKLIWGRLTGWREEREFSRRNEYRRIIVSGANIAPMDYKARIVYRLRVGENGNFTLTQLKPRKTASGKFGEPVKLGKAELTLQASPAAKAGDYFKLTVVSRDFAVDELARALTVVRSAMDANHILVTLAGQNPILAQDVLRCFLDDYLSLNREVRARDTEQMLTYLQSEVSQIKDELESAQAELDAFRESAGVFNLTAEGQQVVDLLTDLQTNLNHTELYASELTRALGDVREGRYGGFAGIPFPTTAEVGQSEIIRRFSQLVQSRQAQLLYKTPQHPDIVSLDEQLAGLRDQVISILQADYDRTKRRLTETRGKIAKLQGKLATFPALQSKLMRLQLAVSVSSETYKYLKGREADARIVLNSIMPDAEVLDPPSEPWKCSRPDYRLNLGTGLVFALVLGLIVAFVGAGTDVRRLTSGRS